MSTTKAKMLTLQAPVARTIVSSYLDPRDLCAVAQTCKHNRELYKENCRVSELLFLGVNITKDRDRKKRLMDLLSAQNQSSQCIATKLAQSSSRKSTSDSSGNRPTQGN